MKHSLQVVEKQSACNGDGEIHEVQISNYNGAGSAGVELQAGQISDGEGFADNPATGTFRSAKTIQLIHRAGGTSTLKFA